MVYNNSNGIYTIAMDARQSSGVSMVVDWKFIFITVGVILLLIVLKSLEAHCV